MRKFADIVENGIKQELTHEEYKFIKSFPLEESVFDFWTEHLTVEGWREYTKANSQGRHGKWGVYQELYRKYKSPLAKLL